MGDRSTLEQVSRLAGLFVAAVGDVALLGQALGHPRLLSFVPGAVAIKANTAIAIVCLGVSLATHPAWPASGGAQSFRARLMHIGGAGGALFLGVATLTQYMSGVDLKLDNLLVQDLDAEETAFPGRPSLFTGLCVVLFALALLAPSHVRHTAVCWSEISSVAGGALAFVVLVGYASSAQGIRGPRGSTPMALETAVLLAVTAVGLLLTRPCCGLMGILSSSGFGGFVSRRLLLFAFTLPPLLDWLGIRCEGMGWYDRHARQAFDTLGEIGAILAVGFWLSYSLESLDTRRKAAQEQAEELGERLDLALSAAGVGTWNLYLPDRRVVWDKRMYRLFGLPEGQERPTLDAAIGTLHPEDQHRIWQEVEATIQTGIPYDTEHRVIWPDGQVLTLKAKGSLVRNAAGEPVRMTGVCWDTTESRQAQEELRVLNLELERRVAGRTEALQAANEELEAFSYSVAHDLRAPLRHLSGFTDLLFKHSGEKLDEKERHYLARIGESARQMGRLIDELLEFSKMGRAELRHARVPMAQLVHDVMREMHVDDAGGRIHFVVGDLPVTKGDISMMRLVLTNLIGNAVKFSRDTPDPRVEIQCRRDGHEWVFWVRDNGVGFDMQYASKLFGVFQRLHNPKDFEGVGIGLANVKRIITRHGGRTWAESKPGEGATFYFTLPAA